MSILGLDVGERRIGVAIAEGILALPFTVVERGGQRADLEVILTLIQEQEVTQIVVGLPRSLDGSLGQQAQRVLAFARELSQHTPIPVETWDERLSTVEAERLLTDSGMKRGKRRAQRDAMAAALVLQSYLDRKSRFPAEDR